MYRGQYEHTIDGKGRVSVPAKFRDFITASNDDRVVITNFRSDSLRCLDVFDYPAWVRLDEPGRILLPPTLRDYAGLSRDVIVTGAGEKFQIWDRVTWNQVRASAENA